MKCHLFTSHALWCESFVQHSVSASCPRVVPREGWCSSNVLWLCVVCVVCEVCFDVSDTVVLLIDIFARYNAVSTVAVDTVIAVHMTWLPAGRTRYFEYTCSDVCLEAFSVVYDRKAHSVGVDCVQ